MYEANEKQATRYNLRRRPIEFKEGDRVLKIATKLSNKADSKTGKVYDKYEGPYIIKGVFYPRWSEKSNFFKNIYDVDNEFYEKEEGAIYGPGIAD